ncbi:MAG: FAD:protein FMN transferase, partial [Acidobacteria bacterium]|nr:FAD:protein FMN transferase [Acidobacteriota bacterium]
MAADRDAALARLERMVRVVEDTEAELSTWRDDSALSALNRQPVGAPLSVSPPVCELLGRLEGWRRATAGAFDPAVGSLIDAWGLRAAGRRPDEAELRMAVA